MELSNRDAWAVIHGIILGTVFLLAFAGGLAGLWSFRWAYITLEGARERLRRLMVGTWGMAIISWLTVITGTYIVYPWYRETPPEGTTDLSAYPRSLLLSDPNTELWHRFAFEWKEHIAFLTPILATAVAFIVTYYGVRLTDKPLVRYAAMAMFVLAFVAAGLAAGFGALVTKNAPI
jgi:hypothetical protein